MAIRTHTSVTRERLYNATVHFALILICLCAIYPIYYVFLISVSDAKYIVTLFPRGFRTTNYELILRQNSILRSYLITFAYCGVGTLISLLLTSLMAYPLTIRSFRFRRMVTILLTVTILFNGGLIPTYMVVRSLGMINTIWAIVLPSSVAAWNVIIYRTFFNTLPDSIRESGRMDGAKEYTILFQLILPLSKPLLATMAVFSIVGIWNNFFSPLLYLTDERLYPVQLILYNMIVRMTNINSFTMFEGVKLLLDSDRSVSVETVTAATIIITTVPILFIYPFFQKHFTKGFMIGSIKG